MSEVTAFDVSRVWTDFLSDSYPEWVEKIIPLGKYSGLLKVTRTWGTFKVRLRDSLILTNLSFQLCCNSWLEYDSKPFSRSFSYTALDDASWIDIEIFPEGGIHVLNDQDIIFIYLATVFKSYIFSKSQFNETNCLGIIMVLKDTWIFTWSESVRRFLEICSLAGKGFWETWRVKRLIGDNPTIVTKLVQDTREPNRQPRTNGSNTDNIANGTTVIDSSGLDSPIQRSQPPQTHLPRDTEASDKWWIVSVNNPDAGLDAFIAGLRDKTQTRAAKLIDRALTTWGYSEQWRARLMVLLDNTKSSVSEVQTRYDPREFLDWLSWSLRDQLSVIEKQLKKAKWYWESYIQALTVRKEQLERKLAWK